MEYFMREQDDSTKKDKIFLISVVHHEAYPTRLQSSFEKDTYFIDLSSLIILQFS